MKDWLPLIGVALGALITIAGTVWQGSRSEARARRRADDDRVLEWLLEIQGRSTEAGKHLRGLLSDRYGLSPEGYGHDDIKAFGVDLSAARNLATRIGDAELEEALESLRKCAVDVVMANWLPPGEHYEERVKAMLIDPIGDVIDEREQALHHRLAVLIRQTRGGGGH